ncbi:EH domain-containing protein 3-like [Chiloscyllium punctatum]|uniref:EH domain-containing protein 3-like n=1 Tax=Chiloscyllium punctatum TaxID=137246 RepID=UPI003B632E4D
MKPLVDVTGRGRRAGAGAVSSCGSLKRSGFGGDFQEEGRASGFKEVIVVAVNCCFSLGLHFPRLSGSMFSWLGAHDRGKKDPEVFQTVTDGLKKLYKSKLLPLEEHYRFHEFHSPALDNADFDNKPMLLLVGQYSTGKTTFIRSKDQKLKG